MQKEKPLVIVTGANGFFAKNLIIKLKKEKVKILAISSTILSNEYINLKYVKVKPWPSREILDVLKLNIQFYKGDVILIHAAGDPKFGNGPHYEEVNYNFSLEIAKTLELYKKGSKYIFCSSVGAQDYPNITRARNIPIGGWTEETKPNPRSDYGKSKLKTELALKKFYGLEVFIARFGMIIGSDMRSNSHIKVLTRSLFKLKFLGFFLTLLDGYLPIVEINDAVKAVIMILRNKLKKGTYLVVGENIKIACLAQKLSLIQLNMRLPKIKLPSIVSLILPIKLSPLLGRSFTYSSKKLRAAGWIPKGCNNRALAEIKSSMEKSLNIIHHDNIAIITGVASGLGRAFFEILDKKNMTIVGIDINEKELRKMQINYSRHKFINIDIKNTNKIIEKLDLENSKNKISLLVLAAGIGRCEEFTKQKNEEINDQLDINLLSRIRLVKFFIPLFSSRESGSIVLVSSSTAIQPLGRFSIYSATNAALLSFGRALSQEINANVPSILTLVPGGMETNFQNSSGVRKSKKEKLLDPFDVALATLRRVEKKYSGVMIFGKNATMMNILSRILPIGFADKFWNLLAKKLR